MSLVVDSEMEGASFSQNVGRPDDFSPPTLSLVGDSPSLISSSNSDTQDSESGERSDIHPSLASMEPSVHLIDYLDNEIKGDNREHE